MGRRRTKGRRPLLNTAKRAALMTALRTGNTRVAACDYAGVSRNSFFEWMRRGRGEDPDRPAKEPYISFAADVIQAEAAAEVFVVSSLRSAIPSDPPSARWWLERRRGWRSIEPEPAMASSTVSTNYIFVTPEQLQALATERIRAERGESEVDDDVRARRARLVSDHPETQ